VSAAEVILNLAILALVLRRNLGSRPVRARRFLFSAAIILVVAVIFLRHVPTQGHDDTFYLAGLAVGCVLGVVAGSIPRVRRDADGAVRTTAAAGFALLWSLVVAARIAFGYCATHLFPNAVASWSRGHEISGSDAFRVMFVLMALGMVASMTLLLAARASRVASASPASVTPGL
jgi:hypothetical protein